jgi:UDP-glucose 4-epimerase
VTRSWGPRVLVTGASGFLGSHVTQALVGRGLAVRALTRRGTAPPAGTEAAPVAALDDAAGLRQALTGVTSVIHLAAYVHRPRSPGDEAAYREVNVDGTVALLDAGVAAGIRDFVFVSTVKAVGEVSREPWTERT